MSLCKKLASAALALLMGIFTGCKKDAADLPADETSRSVIITALNVGKADCFVICSPETVTVIDTGTEESAGYVEMYLNEQGITRIDTLILTHYDRDHVGGADKLIKHYTIGKVYTTSYIAKESDDIDQYTKALTAKHLTPAAVKTETTLTQDGVTWQLFPPEKDDYKKDISNNSSLVVRMTYGKASALFAGDAQKARINELLAIDGLRSDILKMPHHGGWEKNLDDLLDHVQPEYAILTGSDDEPEDEKTLSLLEEYGVEAYSTRSGNVTFITDGTSDNWNVLY